MALARILLPYQLAILQIPTRHQLPNSIPKNVRIVAIVEPKLKFVDVAVEVLFADMVEGANYGTLEQAPDAFNRVGMNVTTHIFSLALVHILRPVGLLPTA